MNNRIVGSTEEKRDSGQHVHGSQKAATQVDKVIKSQSIEHKNKEVII